MSTLERLGETCLDSVEKFSPNNSRLQLPIKVGQLAAGVALFHQNSPVSETGQLPARQDGRVLALHLLMFSFAFFGLPSVSPFPLSPLTSDNISTKYPLAPSSKLLNSHGNRTQLILVPVNTMDILVSPPDRNKFVAWIKSLLTQMEQWAWHFSVFVYSRQQLCLMLFRRPAYPAS